jgi:hypothetical protein
VTGSAIAAIIINVPNTLIILRVVYILITFLTRVGPLAYVPGFVLLLSFDEGMRGRFFIVPGLLFRCRRRRRGHRSEYY